MEALRGVLVVGATNRRDLLDGAMLRPGRFDRIVEIPLPDEEARKAILAVHARALPLADGADAVAFAHRTEGWSGADLAALCHEASLLAIRQAIADGVDVADEAAVAAVKVTRRHLEDALAKVAAQRS